MLEPGRFKNPEIRCSYSKLEDPNALFPHPKNPNKHGPKQLDMFISILNYSGWRRPITVSRLSGFITKGHGALEAAKAAGYTEVPVDYQDYENENMEMADIVADNQLQRMSEMDTGKLQEIMVDLNNGAFNLELTGFDNIHLETLLPPTPGAGTTLAGDGKDQEKVAKEEQTPPDHSAPPPPSQVRMVQLFLDSETIEEFNVVVEHFRGKMGLDNITDTVMAILRSAYMEREREYAETDLA